MKQMIGVIFGGRSTEHDISIVTAISSIIKPLNASGNYDVLPIYITKGGEWYADKILADIQIFRSEKIETYIKSNKPVQLDISNGMTIIKPGLRPVKTKIDVVFPSMHGSNGEDGALMGLLQLANVPFVGCDMTSSAISMNKVLCKQIASSENIPIVNDEHFSKQDYENHTNAVHKTLEKLSLPLFVKPARLGSSIGISKVTSYGELANAIEVALHFDDLVLVEEGVRNLIEVTVPIIGNDKPKVGLVERPLSQADDFFDFDTKYMKGGKKKGGNKSENGAQGYSELPAKLPGNLYDTSLETALAVYKAVGCGGIARVDLLIDSKKKLVYFNEINPLPGSLYAHNWRKAGLSAVELVQSLVDFAVERQKAKEKLENVFTTSFLKQF